MKTLGRVIASLVMLACCPIDFVYGQVQGRLVAWGRDTYGETIVPAGDNFVAVAAGERHSVALRADGSIVTWGDPRWDLQSVPAGKFRAIAAGEHFAAALGADGTLVAWGRNYEDDLNVPSGNEFAAVATGCTHGLALRTDGSLASWGSNTYGQRSVPSGHDFVAIACGGYHSLALRAVGSLVAWGFNYYGQTNVPGWSDFVAIAGGRAQSLAVTSDGTVRVWGGYLGFDYFWSGIPAWSPETGDFARISGGYSNSLGLLADGSLTSWGRDYYGTMNVPPGRDFIAISAGDFHDLAIVIPEPTTFLLLSLGALAAVRRRRTGRLTFCQGTCEDRLGELSARAKPQVVLKLLGP